MKPLFLCILKEYHRRLDDADKAIIAIKLMLQVILCLVVFVFSMLSPLIFKELQVDECESVLVHLISFIGCAIFFSRLIFPLKTVNVSYYLILPIKKSYLAFVVYMMDLLAQDNILSLIFLLGCICVSPIMLLHKLILMTMCCNVLFIARSQARIIKGMIFSGFVPFLISVVIVVSLSLLLVKLPTIYFSFEMYRLGWILVLYAFYMISFVCFIGYVKHDFYKVLN